MANILILDCGLYTGLLGRHLSERGHDGSLLGTSNAAEVLGETAWDRLLMDPRLWPEDRMSEAMDVLRIVLQVKRQRPGVLIDVFTALPRSEIEKGLGANFEDVSWNYYSKSKPEIPPLVSPIRTWIALNPLIIAARMEEIMEERPYDPNRPDALSLLPGPSENDSSTPNPHIDALRKINYFSNSVSLDGIWGHFANMTEDEVRQSAEVLPAPFRLIGATQMAEMVEHCARMFQQIVSQPQPPDRAAVEELLRRFESDDAVATVQDIWSSEWLVVYVLATAYIQRYQLVP